MAAGLGFKNFNTGDVLSAADTNGYLMQGIWVFADATARDAAVTSPQEGNFAYLKDTNVTTYYTGSAWSNIDTTGMTNPMTTTGDTIYSSSGSTPARLPIGSTGNVLTVAGGVPTWAAPAGGGGLTLINTGGTSFSGSDFTISSIPTTYKQLRVVCVNYSINTGGYATIDPNGSATQCFSKVNVGVNTASVGSTNKDSTSIQFNEAQDIAGNTTDSNFLIVDFYNANSTTEYKQFSTNGNFTYASGRVFIQQVGEVRTTSQITSLKFFTNRTFNGGKVYVYGVN